jgi:uncharacterized protein (TIGR00255 family)
MLKSMTGFARASKVLALGHFLVEVQTLNKKYLEVFSTLPKELFSFEVEMKRWVAQRIQRGRVTIKVSVTFKDETPVKISVNKPLLKQLQTAWQEVANGFSGGSLGSEHLSLLAGEESLFLVDQVEEVQDAFRDALHTTLNEALDKLLVMREREGSELASDLLQRIANARKLIDHIEVHAEDAVAKYRKKITATIQEFTEAVIDNEDRILREVCLFADRLDISEELVRFRAHLNAAEEAISKSEGPIGKTLEFFLQELFRETNTIGSKCSNSLISHSVVAIKGELEKMREQVQNVE